MKSLIVLITGLSFTALFAQEGDKSQFSLAEAQAYGVEHHLKMKNAELEWEESKKKVGETRALGFPQIDGAANVNHFNDIPTQVIPASAFDPTAPAGTYIPVQFGIANSATYSFTAKQLLFDGTFIVGLQAAKSYTKLREDGMAKTEIELKDQITKAYYSVLIAEENERIVSENVKKLEDQFNEVQQINKQGMLEDLEVDQLEYILADAKKRIETTKRQVKTAYQVLNFAIGRQIDQPLKLSETLETIQGGYDQSELLSKELSIENHVDYKLISTQERIQELQIKADKASRLPTINAQYYWAQNAFADDFAFKDWYPNSYIGLNLNMPIFTSLHNTKKLQQSKIQLSKLQNERALLEDNLKLQVSMARTAYLDAVEQYETQQKNLNLSKKILETTITKQKNGMASSLDVTVANNQFLETQGRYIGALYQILDAKATLDKSLNNY